MALTELDKAEIRFIAAEEVTRIFGNLREDIYEEIPNESLDRLISSLHKYADGHLAIKANELQEKLRESAGSE